MYNIDKARLFKSAYKKAKSIIYKTTNHVYATIPDDDKNVITAYASAYDIIVASAYDEIHMKGYNAGIEDTLS